MEQKEIDMLLVQQRNEATEALVYDRLSKIEKDSENKKVFMGLSREESSHAAILQKYTGKKVQPNKWKVLKFYWMARILGVTFAVKLMESGEDSSVNFYSQFGDIPELLHIGHDESVHENRLIKMINEERLAYMGSVVLGLNDALVEFTGVLAGFTLALSNAPLIALTGGITGIAAALSMGSSEYLSTKSEKSETKNPIKASVYTSIAYLITVGLLIFPYLIFDSVIIALLVMLLMAIIIIAFFNFYYSVARSENFKKRFIEMAVLSFSVAALSFLIGFLLKYFTGIEA